MEIKERLSSQHPEDLKMVVRMCENVWEQFMLRHISSIKAHWGTMGLKDSPMANNSFGRGSFSHCWEEEIEGKRRIRFQSPASRRLQ